MSVEHFEPCAKDHGDHPCTPVDWDLQERYDKDLVFRAFIDEAIDTPVHRVNRPRAGGEHR